MLAVTEGRLLGGRVAYAQPADDYRTGIEPVLLAASIPARPGELVVEAGTGAGAGLLCLHARVGGLAGMGIELDAGIAGLAERNFAENGAAQLSIWVGDIARWAADRPYDHAFANPPWHDGDSTPSPHPGRARAKRAAAGLLDSWAASLAAGLRRRGTLSFVLPAPSLAAGVLALAAADCPEITMLPLWPRQGEAARLIILRGIRQGRGPCSIRPGLTLHEPNGAYTSEADQILRHGAALP